LEGEIGRSQIETSLVYKVISRTNKYTKNKQTNKQNKTNKQTKQKINKQTKKYSPGKE